MSSFINPTGVIPTPISVLQTTAAAVLPPFPLWLYKLIAAFPLTGLLGLDHFALGSNFTGLMKIIVNLFTLGSWYAFDIVQAYNKANIGQTGLEVPFFRFGDIGKNRISDEPMKTMTRNTQLWLYLLIASIFLGVYFGTSFFLSSSNELLPTLVRWLSKFTFWTGLAIAAYAVIFLLTTKMSSFQSVTTATTSRGVLSNLYGLTGATNPAMGKPTGISSLLSSLPISQRFFGGGDINELKDITSSIIQEGGRKQSFEHIYFLLGLGLIPVVGFAIYTLRNKNSSKI